MWESGYRPVAVYNWNASVPSPGKQPFGREWQNRARLDPPEAAVAIPRLDALNTGILSDGLRPIDNDVNDPNLAQVVAKLALEVFGPAPVRWRADSPRCLLLYRSAEREPHKRVLKGRFGKIEVLGFGQQFVGYGTHPGGAAYLWWPDDPALYHRNTLNAVTEEQVGRFLARAAPLIGADPPIARVAFPPMGRAASPKGSGVLAAHYALSQSLPERRFEPPSGHERTYAAKSLKDEAAKLAALRHGDFRNQALNKAAYAMGTMAGAGWIDRATVESTLFDAADRNGYRAKRGDKAAWDTLQSGLRAGMRKPRAPLPKGPPLVNFKFHWPAFLAHRKK
jgi:hypothetical protein